MPYFLSRAANVEWLCGDKDKGEGYPRSVSFSADGGPESPSGPLLSSGNLSSKFMSSGAISLVKAAWRIFVRSTPKSEKISRGEGYPFHSNCQESMTSMNHDRSIDGVIMIGVLAAAV